MPLRVYAAMVLSQMVDRKGDGMREYRLTITIRKLGRRDVAEENMERLLDAFEDRHPEVGAVIGSNYHLHRLDATFSIDASGAQDATARGSAVLNEIFDAAGFDAPEITEINSVCVSEATVEEADRDLAAA